MPSAALLACWPHLKLPLATSCYNPCRQAVHTLLLMSRASQLAQQCFKQDSLSAAAAITSVLTGLVGNEMIGSWVLTAAASDASRLVAAAKMDAGSGPGQEVRARGWLGRRGSAWGCRPDVL